MKMGKFEITDKVALVTGANRGIGEAYLRFLLKAGAKKVSAAARDINNLTSIVALNPDIIEPVLLDVTNTNHIKLLSEKISSLDILINNAGIANGCNSTSDNALEVARLEMETNYFGPLQVTLAVLPQLKQSSQAAIINVSSIAGISNFPALGPYSATKAAMHSYTQGLRAELASDNIQVVGVYPGPIETRLTEGADIDKEKPEKVASATFKALSEGEKDVLPDAFSSDMYAKFLKHPHELEAIFSQILD